MMIAAPAAGGKDAVGAAESPAVLPTGAEQFSLAIDFQHAAVEGVPFDGIPLPVELNDATPLRRMQFRAGRFCAMEAVRRLDPRRPPMTIGRAERGAPVWPSGVVGSITHTEGFVSAAAARADEVRGLGIDSERIVSAEQAQRVSTLVSWPCELADARQAGLDRLQAMTLVFSVKETIFKCLYPLIGAMFYYHDVRIIGIDGATRTFRARLVKTLSPEFQADTLVEGRFDLSGSRVHTGMWLASR
jgi:enterobactin synthetase component D